MADANLSQQLSSQRNLSQDSFRTAAHFQRVEELLQDNTSVFSEESNFTVQNQDKLCSLSSECTNLCDFPSGSFQTSGRNTLRNDFAQENKIDDAGSLEQVEMKEKEQDFDEESSRGCEDCVGDENVLLHAKNKQLLADLEAGSVFKNGIFLKESGSSLNMKAGSVFKDCVKHSLNIEMVDDTALIGPVLNLESWVGSARIAERNGKRNDNKENNVKKSKLNHGIGNRSRKVLETSEKQKTEAYTCRVCNDGSVKGKYSRKEMEALRFVNVVEQKKIWTNIFSGLRNDVVQEYKALATNSKAQKNNHLNCDHRQNHSRREFPIFLGVLGARETWNPLNVYGYQGMA